MVARDRLALERHLESGPFHLGVEAGRWKWIRTDWPFVHIAVTAVDGKEFVLRFQCDNYPAVPPTAGLWDEKMGQPLAGQDHPRGAGRVAAVFRTDWNNGTCLYLPCDRTAINGHPDWPGKYASMLWRPSWGLSNYLDLVHDLLHSKDYRIANGL